MSKHCASPGNRMGGMIGPRYRLLSTSSQFTPRKKGCSLTRFAPPLMLPSRLERSTLQNDLMMSLASGEITGSCGNTTGFSTILTSLLVRVPRGAIRGNLENSLFVNLDGILVPKRWVPRQELVYQDSQRPPVHRSRVTLVMDYLRREIFWCAAQSVSLCRP